MLFNICSCVCVCVCVYVSVQRNIFSPLIFSYYVVHFQVYFLPLPPLRLDQHDHALIETLKKEGANEDQMLVARARLWYAQANARRLYETYTALAATSLQDLTVNLFKTSKIAIINATLLKFSAFVEACLETEKPIDPMDFIRFLFWPRSYDQDTTAFSPDMQATLIAESAGLCSIIRDREDGTDRVYAHPTVVRTICDRIWDRLAKQGASADRDAAPKKNIVVPLDDNTKCMLEAVIQLCKIMEDQIHPSLPSDEKSAKVGKLYAELMINFLKCRAMTGFKNDEVVSLHQLLCLPSIDKTATDQADKIKVSARITPSKRIAVAEVVAKVSAALSKVRVDVRSPVQDVPVTCFPRITDARECKVSLGEQMECLKGEKRSSTIYSSNSYSNMVEDARLILDDVYIALQCKECSFKTLGKFFCKCVCVCVCCVFLSLFFGGNSYIIIFIFPSDLTTGVKVINEASTQKQNQGAAREPAKAR